MLYNTCLYRLVSLQLFMPISQGTEQGLPQVDVTKLGRAYALYAVVVAAWSTPVVWHVH